MAPAFQEGTGHLAEWGGGCQAPVRPSWKLGKLTGSLGPMRKSGIIGDIGFLPPPGPPPLNTGTQNTQTASPSQAGLLPRRFPVASCHSIRRPPPNDGAPWSLITPEPWVSPATRPPERDQKRGKQRGRPKNPQGGDEDQSWRLVGPITMPLCNVSGGVLI